MKIENIKKNKYQQVAEIMDKQGYILDEQSASIFGENNLHRVHEHIRIYKKLQQDREFFKDKKIVEFYKGYRKHLIRLDTQEEGSYYKVGKEFYNELKRLN